MTSTVRVFSTALVCLISSQASAQGTGTQPAQAPVRVPGSAVTVTAQKEPADPATLPISVTAIPEDLIKAAGISFISDAGILSPNTHFTEFTARKLSNPRIRGIGASPANPGVVTYVDGVPQFNANSTSFDLVDVGQIEFVRGPQSALFGRNALGGLINITSGRPSLTKWGGNVQVPFGTDSLFETRASVSGPLVTNKLAAGFSMAFSRRDGFTRNAVTDNLVDEREGFTGKGQVLWTPTSTWEARVIVAGERARDGDYALNDLAAVRATPFEVMRDFEGFTNRDLFTTTGLVRREGSKISFSSTTGIVRWKTADETDLDYSPLPLATRTNDEDATQFTQEFRFSSAPTAPLKISDGIGLRWQAGAFFFTQDYGQLAVNSIGPFVFHPEIPFAVQQTSPDATLEDVGIGVYGQGTLAFSNRLDVSFGARVDRENRKAELLSGFTPFIGAPVTVVNAERDYTDVSPQAAVAYRVKPGTLIYGSVSRAFKAGGFNPVSLPGDESYGEEHAWHVEGGVKVTAANGRYSATASVFSIDWDDLQLNLPILGAAGQFFISNVGSATSRGAEFEIAARPYDGVDLFGVFGFTRARFGSSTSANGADVSDNKVPNTPAYTATFGAQISRALTAGGRIFGRAEVACFGAFEYDEANTQRQDDYTVTNLRAGWRGKRITVEAWMRNAFDTNYVPVAFAYQFAQSGFIGEPGRPRTAGITVGIGF
jgi:iron complex outermembrane receptor protein